MKKLNILFLFICYSWGCIAQPMKQMIQVSVVPNSENWLYKLGKDAVFTVTVTKNGIPMKGIKIRYELSQDMLEPFKQKELLLKDGITTINAGTLRKAGFLRCRAFVTIKVPHPVAVRYAFDNYVEGDLFCGGLPLSSFRSDNW